MRWFPLYPRYRPITAGSRPFALREHLFHWDVTLIVRPFARPSSDVLRLK